MNSVASRSFLNSQPARWVSLILVLAIFTLPLRAQQPTNVPAKTTDPVPAAKPAAPQDATTKSKLTFDTLLSTDSYKMYGEVRNVGTLLTTGGAGEIVEPILKLSDPGPEFKSIVSFLKKNSEALATSRLMFASWPARKGIPDVFVAIEFASREDAAKFSPKLETFLPTILPPVPVQPEPTPESSPAATPATATATLEVTTVPPTPEVIPATAKPTPPLTPEVIPAKAKPTPPPAPTPTPEMRLPFVITHASNLVFITDKSFQLEKLHPKSSPLLFEDNNFRVARNRFSAEPIFLFFNIELEDRTRPKPSPTPVISEEEQERMRQEQEALMQKQLEEARAEQEKAGQTTGAVLTVSEPDEPEVDESKAAPTPTPSKEQEAQAIASNQLGSLFSSLGQGEPQWPDAIGVALALENEEYALKAILIESQDAKRLTLPFVPQVIAGPVSAADAPSVLPDDVEVLATVSIDLKKTLAGMRETAAKNAAADVGQPKWQRWENGVLIDKGPPAEKEPDAFEQFEKKSGLKIAEDLLPVLGNEIAVATSLDSMDTLRMFGIPTPPQPPRRSAAKNDKEKSGAKAPIFLIAVKDREAAKRLIPKVMAGLGIGDMNLIAQNERRDDSELVNYAGVVAYGFVGNFLVMSDAASVRRVADAYGQHRTLSTSNVFRNARHWQPRQTLGELYVSPAMMEGYQEQVRKQAGTMDQAMRDFLMQMSPANGAITYALSHDGLGSVHEMHLPKNLILAMVAGTSATMNAMKQGSPEMNEMIAIGVLQMLAGAEESYKSTTGRGSYGTVDSLIQQKLIDKSVLENFGYRFDLQTSSTGFEATAVPSEYGKSGKRSFYVDQSGVVRGDDHGGGPAGKSDNPVQ
jgi:hypothetical protein